MRYLTCQKLPIAGATIRAVRALRNDHALSCPSFYTLVVIPLVGILGSRLTGFLKPKHFGWRWVHPVKKLLMLNEPVTTVFFPAFLKLPMMWSICHFWDPVANILLLIFIGWLEVLTLEKLGGLEIPEVFVVSCFGRYFTQTSCLIQGALWVCQIW